MKKLTLDRIFKSFQGQPILSNISAVFDPCVIHAVIGENGTGKSTLLNVVTGFTKLDSGSVQFSDAILSSMKPYEIAQRGVARTFQKNRLIEAFTVEENLRFAAADQSYLWESFTQSLDGSESPLPYSSELLEMFELEQLRNYAVGCISFGQKKLVSLACALVRNPKLLLLDEPSTGLSKGKKRLVSNALFNQIKEGTLVVVVEHDEEMMGLMECKKFKLPSHEYRYGD